MTGPEHYQEAEKLVRDAAKLNGADRTRTMEFLSAAQVHATLAQAAAIAMGNATETDRTNWRLATRN